MKEPPSFPANRQEYYLEKPLPSSDESEKVILGAILLDNSNIDAAAEILQPGDFYSPLNRRVYAAMLILNEAVDRKIDPILIGEVLKKEGSLESIGGTSTITNLTFGLPHFSNIDEYLKVVKDKSKIRQLIKLNNSSTSSALSDEYEADELLEQAEAALFALSDSTNTSQFVSVRPIVDDSIAHAQQVASTGSVLTGISTGFIDLDSILLGLNKTDFIVLAARPSMGKTALGLCLAQNAAIRGEATVAVFSMEMSKKQLVDRMICSEARINSSLYRTGMLDSTQWDRVNVAAADIRHAKIFIDESTGISPAYMRPRLRRLKSSQGALDLVVVDYIQLMEDLKYSNQGRQQEITRISRHLKGLAKEFDVPVVALSQLSRKPEERSDKRPIMSDLRESGAIEQDADVVAFIYRDDYYNDNSETPGVTEIIISKNRNGPTGTKNLAFDKPSTRFSDLSLDF